MKVRVKFSKAGSMKFIGHLDVMRYFQKAIRRSGLDIGYSQGFNPHQLISFASPLGVGLTSDGEYMDMQMKSSLSSKEAVRRLNEVMNDEIQVLEYWELDENSKNAMSIVAAADYCVSLKDGYEFVDQFHQKFDEFLTQEQIMITKKTKKSERVVDVKPYIYDYAYSASDFEKKTGSCIENSVAQVYENGTCVYLQMAAGSVVNIKPEMIMEAFCEYAKVKYEPFAYQIHRRELYADRNADPKAEVSQYGKNRDLVSLGWFGHVIEEEI